MEWKPLVHLAIALQVLNTALIVLLFIRMEYKFRQLRNELREEMYQIRDELRDEIAQLRDEMHGLFANLTARLVQSGAIQIDEEEDHASA